MGLRVGSLIVDLHGFTSTIDQQNLFSDLPRQASERGYVVVTPQGEPATLTIGGEDISAPFWNIDPDRSAAISGAQDDVGFLTDLLDTTERELCIDDSRLYVTGNSNGAGMSATLPCALPGRFAAIAPVSGINLAATCESLEPVSVIAFHGDTDPLVPYEGGSAASVKIDSPSVQARVAEFAKADGCDAQPQTDEAFEDVTVERWVGCRTGTAVELSIGAREPSLVAVGTGTGAGAGGTA